MADENHRFWQALLGGTGVVAVIIGLVLSSNNQSGVAIDVARQHGSELLEIRSEIKILRDYINDRTRLRYTQEDADKDMKYLEAQLKHIENEIIEHEESHR